MKRMTFIVCIVMCLAFSLVAQKAKFIGKSPKKGSVITSDQTMQMEMTMTAKANGKTQSFDVKQIQKRKLRHTILKAKKDYFTKVKTEYLSGSLSQTDPMGNPRTMQEPVVGKIFIVERKGKKLKVHYESGGQPTPLEMQLVNKDHQALGKKNPFYRILHKKTVKVGKRVKVKQKYAMEIMAGESDGVKVRKFKLTLKELREEAGFECGVFDMQVLMEVPFGGGPPTQMNLKGEMIIGVKNCLPVAMNLKGPMKMHAKQGPQEMTGKGEVELNISYEYELK